MDCNEARRLLEAYVDGEMELTRQLDLEAHLAGCTSCKKAAETATKFRNAIHMNMPVYKAPPELKAKVQAVLRKESKSKTEWISAIRRPLLCGAAVLVVCVLSVAAWMTTLHDKERALIAQAIWNHSHSLLVASARRHSIGSTYRKGLVHREAGVRSSGSGSVGGKIRISRRPARYVRKSSGGGNRLPASGSRYQRICLACSESHH